MSINNIICPIEFDESLIKHSASFSVPGKPFGKQRPRVVTRGGFARAYTPKETVEYENKVRSSYKQSVERDYKLSGPISAQIEAIFEVPKSVSKKEKERLLSEEDYTKKPDCDNIAKSILDALNEISYEDDSQVCELYVRKKYGIEAKTNVYLEEIKHY